MTTEVQIGDVLAGVSTGMCVSLLEPNRASEYGSLRKTRKGLCARAVDTLSESRTSRRALTGESGDFQTENRADSGANAATTEGNHGRLSYPAASKSPDIRTSDVRGRDKAMRFPMGQVNRKHGKGIPRLLYTESVMRAPELGALRPPTITRVQ